MKKFIALFLVLSLTLPTQAFFWNKKDKIPAKELDGKGYAGELPRIENKIEKPKTEVAEPIYEPQQNFDTPANIKPAPQNNPAFIDIIQKQDNTSEYINDINEIISMLEKVYDSIDNNENVQLFVSKGLLLTTNVDYLLGKYKNKPEYYYESFKKLTEVSKYTKSIMTLRKEAAKYQRYLAYTESGSIYNPTNIEQQLEYLKEEINSAIILLREEN